MSRWMICILLVLLMGMGAVSAQTPDVTPEATPDDALPAPLVMLTEFDPWSAVVGADTPTFVLYDTGQVIYRRVNEDVEAEFYTVMLDADEQAALLDELAIDEDFFALDEYYDPVLMTDQPNSVIAARGEDGAYQRVSVYGDLRAFEDVRAAAPAPFVELFMKLIAYEHPDAALWLPERFEAMLWLYENGSGAAWPDDWPGFDSPYAVERDHLTSIYLPIEELDRFRALMDDAWTVALDGKTWAVSMRFPFPHEYAWEEV